MARIYVASLSDYNCGILHGEWFDIEYYDAAAELEQDIMWMLAKSPAVACGDTDIAEEFAIHDYEGFGGFRIGEYESLAFVVRLSELIEDNEAPFAVFIENIHTCNVETVHGLDCAESAFRDAWIGNMSAEDYAAERLDEWAEEEGVPESLRTYLDHEKFARDLVLGGGLSEYYESGEFYLFSGHY